MITAYNLTVGE